MRYVQPTAMNEREWKKWVAERPESIRKVCERFDPWTLYRLKPTGQRVYILSFSEPGADGKVLCRIGVSAEFNLLTFERDVFGIDPDDLEECDLPKDDEQVGSLDLPIDVVKNLRDQYQDGVPQHVMIDLIARYPLKQKRTKSADDEQ